MNNYLSTITLNVNGLNAPKYGNMVTLNNGTSLGLSFFICTAQDMYQMARVCSGYECGLETQTWVRRLCHIEQIIFDPQFL